MKIRSLQLSLLVCFLMSITQALYAQSFPNSSIPEPLKTWVPWVLDDIPDHSCLHDYTDASKRECSWPGKIELQINEKNGTFKQNWKLFKPGWIPLPGNERAWPLQVQANNQSIPVILKDGVPSIYLQSGEYLVTGQFRWFQTPETLALNSATAVVQLWLNGEAISNPKRSDANELNLQSRTGNIVEAETQVNIFRKITDDVPLQYSTYLKLDVSGKPRDIVIPNIVFKNSVPFAITSSLGSQVLPNGDLKIQAISGQHVIQIHARFLGNPTEISLADLPSNREEIWVFSAKPELRAASIEGLSAIDPQQSLLPQDWKTLPAYLAKSGSKVQLVESRRGNTNQSPDQLKLERNWWLSFDGKKISMLDSIAGVIQQPGRINIQAEAQLGRVDMSGVPQVISISPENLSGVEVKRGNVQLAADSVAPRTWSAISAVSWARNFDQVSINLNLPPGWRLIHVSGVDRAPGTWVTQWDLLQIFVVLMITFSFRQLLGNKVALLALVTMLLTYQESDAPRYTWLAILLIIGILRVLPAGNLKIWFERFRLFGFTALILIALNFLTQQVRTAIYPVLELDSYSQNGMQPQRSVAAPARIEEVQTSSNVQQDAPTATFAKSAVAPAPQREIPPPSPYYDLDAKVQTGPGMPTWEWRRIQLAYDGAVNQEQKLKLYLVSPLMNKFLTLIRVILLIALLYYLFNAHKSSSGSQPGEISLKKFKFPSFKKSVSSAAAFWLVSLGLGLCTTLTATDAKAQLPSKEQLEELKQKITRPASCLPRCAEFSQLQIQFQNNDVSLRLHLDALEAVSFPLPLHSQSWLPHQALLNKQPAHVLLDEKGWAWVALPRGSHLLEISGSVKNIDVLNLPLATKPHWVELIGSDWQLSGWNAEQGASDNLQLTKKQAVTVKNDSTLIPAFVNVKRAISIDKEWTVTTTVERINGQGAAVFQLPLLEGESVTTPNINVTDGQVAVNLGGNNVLQSWRSVMKPKSQLSLSAGTEDYTETWSIESNPAWHVEAKGIQSVAQADGNVSAQFYRPWPGEKLEFNITKPKAQAGNSLTILSSQLITQPGGRSTDYSLKLSIRSAMGGEHKIFLPAGAVLQDIRIQHASQPIQPLKNKQGLLEVPIPLLPGVQEVELTWRSDQEISPWFGPQQVDLKIGSTNHWSVIKIPPERWLLWVSGPGVGPALLFWGQLLILFAAGLVLARNSELPLKRLDWLLLALGLTQVDWWACALVVIWFFAMHWRQKSGQLDKPWTFNLRQVGLVGLSIALLTILGSVVVHGLLGHPHMQLSGLLAEFTYPMWYVDQIDAIVPETRVFTLPLLAYRLLMLLWALWLAGKLLRWLKWGWSAWSAEGIWRKKIIAPANDLSGG